MDPKRVVKFDSWGCPCDPNYCTLSDVEIENLHVSGRLPRPEGNETLWRAAMRANKVEVLIREDMPDEYFLR